MADLDFFKKVNDTDGHDAGDTVLKTFAVILTAHTHFWESHYHCNR